MKKKITLLLFVFSFVGYSQNTTQTINSASIISSNSLISVGEIYVTPLNPDNTSSGIIGILSQINQQTLEVKEFEIANNIIAYPNPTTSKLFFNNLEMDSKIAINILNNSGGLIAKKNIDPDNSLNLEFLPAGIYLIQFQNKSYKSFKIIKH